MSIGYLLGGLFCLLYMFGVGYFGGIKKNPGLLNLVKKKINKKMSDKTAATISLVFAIIIGLVGVFLLIFGATR